MTNRKDLKIGVVVLAAGGSRRMGGKPKQFLQFRGATLLRRAAEAALKLNRSSTVVVLGAHDGELRSELIDLPVKIAVNVDWAVGISSSIKLGLLAISDEEVDAVIFMLCDQPLVSECVLERLRDHFIEVRKPIIASRYEDSLGVPALFSREIFDELKSLQGDEGAKKIITMDVSRVFPIDVAEAAFDIDTIDDYERLNKDNAVTAGH